MTCRYCGCRIGEAESRCGRCGRRPGDTLTPAEPAVCRTDGALAAQSAPVEVTPAAPPISAVPGKQERVATPPRPGVRRPVQRPLFQDGTSNVIPIESYVPPRPETRRPADADSGVDPASRPQLRRRAPARDDAQGSLFLPPVTAKPLLGTTVEAMISRDAPPVAARLHRAVAAALDWSMILIGYGLFLLVFRLAGGEIVLTKPNLPSYGGMLALIACAYGLAWPLAGSETPGMRWTRLRLSTFDGFPPELRQRLLRFAGCCLSVCSVVGLGWSFGDEEALTWQDHISRTFPTPLELDTRVFQRR